MTMIIINVCLLIVALILAIITHKQNKLLIEYDNCLKKQGNMARLMFLANFAKVCGHDVEIRYSTIHDYTHVLFYKNGWGSTNIATLLTVIDSDETFKEATKELERLIK